MNRRAEIVDAAGPGGLGGTFAGNPMSCEAALAALDALAEEKLLDSAARCAGPGLARALAAGRS
jgi:4-aminobutyrate aminotransferase-like enzyme